MLLGFFVFNLGVTVDSYSCLDPGIPVSGIRYGQDFSIGSTVSFGCDSGYRLSHEEPLVCEKNHWWSHPLPTCDGKFLQNSLVTYSCTRSNKLSDWFDKVFLGHLVSHTFLALLTDFLWNLELPHNIVMGSLKY